MASVEALDRARPNCGAKSSRTRGQNMSPRSSSFQSGVLSRPISFGVRRAKISYRKLSDDKRDLALSPRGTGVGSGAAPADRLM